MSLKIKCHRNLNVPKTKMLQETNFIKTRRLALIALALFSLYLHFLVTPPLSPYNSIFSLYHHVLIKPLFPNYTISSIIIQLQRLFYKQVCHFITDSVMTFLSLPISNYKTGSKMLADIGVLEEVNTEDN